MNILYWTKCLQSQTENRDYDILNPLCFQLGLTSFIQCTLQNITQIFYRLEVYPKGLYVFQSLKRTLLTVNEVLWWEGSNYVPVTRYTVKEFPVILLKDICVWQVCTSNK